MSCIRVYIYICIYTRERACSEVLHSSTYLRIYLNVHAVRLDLIQVASDTKLVYSSY